MVVADDGRFVLLFSDGGYAAKSWQEMITSGITADKEKQKASLAWIREQSLAPSTRPIGSASATWYRSTSSPSMGSGSKMFRHASSAAEVARDGFKAMRAGKAVCLQGPFTKAMAFGSRLVPRSIARKMAMKMNS